MNINWVLRFKNKPVLVALVAAVVALIYQVLGLLGITPGISQDQITEVVGILINILVMLGIVVDPSTKGMGDSAMVLEYDEPRAESVVIAEPEPDDQDE